MARYKPRDRNQSRLVIVSHDTELEPGTLGHAIDHIIEGFDLSTFNERYKNDESGRKAIHPKTLLKIILLGYLKRQDQGEYPVAAILYCSQYLKNI